MNQLGRLWSGALPVDEAFWTYAVIGGIAVNAVTSFLFLMLVTADLPFLAIVVGYGLSVPYNVVALVGVWRAQVPGEDERTKADVMRIVTLVGMVLLTVT